LSLFRETYAPPGSRCAFRFPPKVQDLIWRIQARRHILQRPGFGLLTIRERLLSLGEEGCTRGPQPEEPAHASHKRRDVSPGTVHRLLGSVYAAALSVGADLRAVFHAHFMGPHLGASVLSPVSISVTSVARTSHFVRVSQHPCRHLSCGLTGGVRRIFSDHGNYSCVSGRHDVVAERRAEAAS